ncbi:hypothetical protein JCM10369A_24910 [Nocardioides pyridinolyticus]
MNEHGAQHTYGAGHGRGHSGGHGAAHDVHDHDHAGHDHAGQGHEHASTVTDPVCGMSVGPFSTSGLDLVRRSVWTQTELELRESRTTTLVALRKPGGAATRTRQTTSVEPGKTSAYGDGEEVSRRRWGRDLSGLVLFESSS